MPRTTRKVPKPMGICSIGIKFFQGLIPCSLLSAESSALFRCVSIWFCSFKAIIISRRMGSVLGFRFCIFAPWSDAPSIGFRSARRTIRPAPTILAHHGRPLVMCKCSINHSIIAAGPHPKSSPSSFKYPMCSGMEEISVPSSSLASGRLSNTLFAGVASGAGVDEVELKRIADGPAATEAVRQGALPEMPEFN